MSIKVVKGNIFNSSCQTVVNTVNCVGVMGKGIALVYKLRYPNMFAIYKKHCDNRLIETGKLWLYKEGDEGDPWVLNFPTKNHWKYPSKMEYIESGLKKFMETYKLQGITSIAFPLLGAHNGGLERNDVLTLMTSYLDKCEIPVEVYEFDPHVSDDLYEAFRTKWNKVNTEMIKSATGMRSDKIKLVTESLNDPKVNSMMALINIPKLGNKTLEKCFKFIMNNNHQKPLF
jgi:O-acetyl-ADP-ribose deacetylase (regulator of RNase III)